MLMRVGIALLAAMGLSHCDAATQSSSLIVPSWRASASIGGGAAAFAHPPMMLRMRVAETRSTNGMGGVYGGGDSVACPASRSAVLLSSPSPSSSSLVRAGGSYNLRRVHHHLGVGAVSMSSSSGKVEVAKEGVCDAAVRRYWDGMNRRDPAYALEQFSDSIFFQDMMFPEPFTGKERLKQHFETCLAGFPDGLMFVIDEISIDSGDGKCGAYWHCETPEGKAFPFSRGLSFYKCDGEGKLTFAREIPEPSAKPGSAGLTLAKFGSFMMRFIPESMTFPKV